MKMKKYKFKDLSFEAQAYAQKNHYSEINLDKKDFLEFVNFKNDDFFYNGVRCIQNK